MLRPVTVERARIDDVAEPDAEGFVEYAYRGWHYAYWEPDYRLGGTVDDRQPALLTISRPPDPPRQGFDEETPYDDPRFVRAVLALLASANATRIECLDCGVDGTAVLLDLGQLSKPG
jgi:hypothetical protein